MPRPGICSMRMHAETTCQIMFPIFLPKFIHHNVLEVLYSPGQTIAHPYLPCGGVPRSQCMFELEPCTLSLSELMTARRERCDEDGGALSVISSLREEEIGG